MLTLQHHFLTHIIAPVNKLPTTNPSRKQIMQAHIQAPSQSSPKLVINLIIHSLLRQPASGKPSPFHLSITLSSLLIRH